VVEDDPLDLDLALRALRHAHPEVAVDIARDGAEAWAYLAREGAQRDRGEEDPAAVLLDLKLPKLTGIEVLTRVRQHATLRHLPVVMFTSSREARDLARAYECGANAYLVKPAGYDGMEAAMQTVGAMWGKHNVDPPRGTTMAPPADRDANLKAALDKLDQTRAEVQQAGEKIARLAPSPLRDSLLLANRQTLATLERSRKELIALAEKRRSPASNN
jgi:CheY-like chemotaxis protein